MRKAAAIAAAITCFNCHAEDEARAKRLTLKALIKTESGQRVKKHLDEKYDRRYMPAIFLI